MIKKFILFDFFKWKKPDCVTIVTWPHKEKSEYKHMLIYWPAYLILNIEHVYIISITKVQMEYQVSCFLFTLNKKDTWYKLCVDVFDVDENVSI